MSNTLKIMAEGFVGDDPKYYAGEKDGKNYVNFSIAHTDRYKDNQNGNWVEGKTTWLKVKAWGNLADNVANSVYKSDPVSVEGRFMVEEYTDKENKLHKIPTIHANKVLFNMDKGVCTFRRIPSQNHNNSLLENDGLPSVVNESIKVDQNLDKKINKTKTKK
ncbi:MAG: single-stranded DNA-binding protein [Bifidobacteriaceae bacterium]|jgi:single-strand DNA-binding protein|nr:single-stranded DNA-binding protein [Bifidobacteriaceae bacterium]